MFKESRYSREMIDPMYDMIMKIGPKRAVKAVRESEEYSELIPAAFLDDLETLLANPLQYGKQSVVPQEPMAVICHGDYLRNNLAFQYDEQKNPTSVMMFDFQTLRYASPMVDLSTFIANSTGYEVRSKHFDEIFKSYYEALVNAYCEMLKVEAKDVPDYFR
jgi:Ser/Thr protein kinase RdoA (MazF antagonist)